MGHLNVKFKDLQFEILKVYFKDRDSMYYKCNDITFQTTTETQQ